MRVPERRRSTVSNPSTNRKPSALVLYLEQNIAALINYALELMGYRTRLTPSAAEALSILDGDDRRYLVFMDNFHLLEEPQLFLAELQARPELRRRVRVVGVTPFALPIEWLSAPFDQIDDFLAMPFTAEELFEKIEAVSATL
jgi:CheY-like chemotaxis protein